MVQIFKEKYPELPVLFLSYYGLWKTSDFLSDASSWASSVHSSWPTLFAWRCLNIWLIRLCVSMIGIDRKIEKIEKTPSVIQPNPQHCRIVLSPSYTFLSVLSSPVINASDNGFPLENCSPLATTVIMNWDWDYIQSQEGRFQCNMYKRRMEEAAKLKRWTEYREPVFQSKRHITE